MQNLGIYSITNSVNGKVYIGQTRQRLARRKAELVYRFNLGERDHKLYQAMRKYGLGAFKFETICNALSVDALDDLERHFIEKHNSFRRGYNMTCGGDSVSEQTRSKISTALKGRKITWHAKMWESRRNNPNNRSPKGYVAKGAAHSKAGSYSIRFPNGEEKIVVGLNAFCKEHRLTAKCLYDVLEGKQKHHKGFVLLAKFNDQLGRAYARVGGNGACPAALAG